MHNPEADPRTLAVAADLIKAYLAHGLGALDEVPKETRDSTVQALDAAARFVGQGFGGVANDHGDDGGKACSMPVVERLRRLANLKPGWNGYQAPIPASHAIGLAARLVDAFDGNGIGEGLIAPSVGGGISSVYRRGTRRVAVEIGNDGVVLALFADDTSEAEPWVLRATPDAVGFQSLASEVEGYLGNLVATHPAQRSR